VPVSTRSRSFRIAALAAAAATVGTLGAACAPPPAKSISGTISGADARYVDAMIGFDVIDASGKKIEMDGLNNGYSVVQRINHCVPTNGAVASTKCAGTGITTTKNWTLKLPSNTSKVYIEVYPKAPTPTAWLTNYRGYTGPAVGSTNLSTYARTFRRAIPVNGAVSNVSLVLPKVCGVSGGTTGSLVGHISGFGAGKINAWSMSPDGTKSMGFSSGTIDGNGNYRIDQLQSGQRYGVIATSGSKTKNLVDYRRSTSNDTLIPGPCATKAFNF
jgi:hypothetical protein